MLQIPTIKNTIDKFHCTYCGKEFQARITTWIDVSKTPEARLQILQWEFNIVRCPVCGYQAVADSPFFYEDFDVGLLIAVYPSPPINPAAEEVSIRSQYGYYPHIEFFYDLTQLWVLVYWYFYHREYGHPYGMVTSKEKEDIMHKSIRLIKTDVAMLHIGEKLRESFYEPAAYDELLNAVERLICSMEGTCSYGFLTRGT